MMKQMGILAAVCLLAFAAEGSSDSPPPDINSIREDLVRFCSIAEQTKENIDYQPFIVSVISGKRLEAIGAGTLLDALKTIPGIDVFIDNLNYVSISFRGSNPLAYGQSRLFIDDVAVNDLAFDGYSPYLQMPIELIKRIEVTRGPGAQTDGINAYAGMIRVVTYAEDTGVFKKRSSVFAFGGSRGRLGGGAVLHTRQAGFRIDADAYYSRDDSHPYAGSDALSQGLYGRYNEQFSETGDAPLWLRTYAFGLTVAKNGLTFKTRLLGYEQGAAYGINYALQPESDRISLPRAYADLAWEHTFEHRWDLTLKAGLARDTFESSGRYMPPGIIQPDQLNVQKFVVFPEGFFGRHKLALERLYQSGKILERGWKHHRVEAGYRFTYDHTLEEKTITTNRSTGTGMTDYSQTFPFFDPGARMNTLSIYAKDNWDIGDRTVLTYGLNYEKSDVASEVFNPRVAFVHQYSAEGIVKLLYSRSSRLPSWQELFIENNFARRGNRNLEYERVNAYEVSHIWKFSPGQKIRTNVFYLDNRNQITLDPATHRYVNGRESTQLGVGVEFNGHLSLSDSLYLSYTWQDARIDSDTAPNVSQHLAKGYYLYRFTPALSGAVNVFYASPKPRMPSDDRRELAEVLRTDLSLNYRSLADGMSLSVTVQNLFDYDNRMPSLPKTYADDYREPGRGLTVTIRKTF